MKKIQLIFVLGFLALSSNCFSQILVNSNGYVGINQTVPAYNLDWYGNGRFWSGWGQLIFDNSGTSGTVNIHPHEDWVGGLGSANKRFNHIYCYILHYDQLEDWSDERLKENIKPLGNSLNKIKLLNGVSYNMKKEFYNVKDPTLLSKLMDGNKNDFGFLAQEVKEIIPDIVSLDTTNNMYSVNYVKLIPVLVEAIKEQQAKIEELQTRIETIEEECCNNGLKSTSISTDANVQSSSEIAILYQNNPNPFKDKTNIRCFIPQNSNESWLYIYDLNGVQLDQFKVNGEGIQSVTVPGSKFKPGMFLYSLIIDGREVDTKRMILTK